MLYLCHNFEVFSGEQEESIMLYSGGRGGRRKQVLKRRCFWAENGTDRILFTRLLV